MSDSFVMYRSFHESLKELSREQYGNVMFAINEYALNGTETELSGVERAVFMLMKPQIDANERRRENGRRGADCGKKGGRPKKENPIGVIESEKKNPIGVIENAEENPIGVIESAEEKPLECETETPNVNANANENVNANANAEGVPCGTHGFSCENPPPAPESHADPPKKTQRFVRPTLDEIAAYCAERKNGVDARTFFDFYESKGWTVGTSRMRDWRACVRTWERRKKTECTGGRNRAGAMWGNEGVVPQETIDLI